ncbi:hypothetical protein [Pseudomonas gingeri]|uniref:Uncharacterized protein n=1 Tax=Pseudomonas gingeri TaxID=117681 RepID=A0A7Y7WTG2_9PSED|nr:hypothetical protein [Pseudomonas gingeri]NWB86980.1 hypothetical protein [Pseudomonas gingeri]
MIAAIPKMATCEIFFMQHTPGENRIWGYWETGGQKFQANSKATAFTVGEAGPVIIKGLSPEAAESAPGF